ncbi:universal stress protein domain-containing protein, UspA family [Gottschalkia acidurici 9a]|uniref:Universal stress protein domain-containing protein, UspA family n=1 Tax=Gottschalkia acidurici (strain ATCC 7906 / DSM 604 / BCRC 14475 / CIP 104303 / KCTC 5404 / NCIMB 10678 / 9a) TaxID=1128398 RepID=K0B2R3_GOTA9|nr:universal stress protein [Gottschalkia acidurici]AFS79230.1 universal stress protein domain-containing protein, UspA family [Gottschalkia acidurici 9a]
MNIKKILVPVDGSEPNKKAIDEAKDMAARFNSKVYLLHVVDVDYLLDHSVLSDLKSQRARILDEAVSHFEGIDVEKTIVLGNPSEEIMRKADEEDIDLIIMAKRGLTGLQKYLIGSVTSKVVSHSKKPVLVLP